MTRVRLPRDAGAARGRRVCASSHLVPFSGHEPGSDRKGRSSWARVHCSKTRARRGSGAGGAPRCGVVNTTITTRRCLARQLTAHRPPHPGLWPATGGHDAVRRGGHDRAAGPELLGRPQRGHRPAPVRADALPLSVPCAVAGRHAACCARLMHWSGPRAGSAALIRRRPCAWPGPAVSMLPSRCSRPQAAPRP